MPEHTDPGAPASIGWAVAAVASGALGVLQVPLCGLLAVILGVVALRMTRRWDATRAVAVAGFVLGAAGVAVGIWRAFNG